MKTVQIQIPVLSGQTQALQYGSQTRELIRGRDDSQKGTLRSRKERKKFSKEDSRTQKSNGRRIYILLETEPRVM